MKNADDIHNVESAAERLGVTPEIVRDLIRAGKLRAVVVGDGRKCRPQSIIVRESWLMEWLEQTSLTGPTGDR